MSEKRRFKAGDFVVPLDEEQAYTLSAQHAKDVGPFPWRVCASEGQGRDEFLSFACPDKDYRGYYAFRFKLAPVLDNPLEDYM